MDCNRKDLVGLRYKKQKQSDAEKKKNTNKKRYL
jgi:hypothetical protein